MNKSVLLEYIKNTLLSVRNLALNAAIDAHNIATHEENVAENKYDTLGLEAAYLAHGQSQRVAECESAIVAYNQLTSTAFTPETPISLGALITLVDQDGVKTHVFLGPASGGVTFTFNKKDITLITSLAPLGRALLGCYAGDDIEVNIAGKINQFEIADIC